MLTGCEGLGEPDKVDAEDVVDEVDVADVAPEEDNGASPRVNVI